MPIATSLPDYIKYEYDHANDLIVESHYDPIDSTLKKTYKYSMASVGSPSEWRSMVNSVLQSDSGAQHKLQVNKHDPNPPSIVSNKELMIKAIENLTTLMNKSIDYTNHSGYADDLHRAARIFAQDSEQAQTYRILDENYMTAIGMLQNALVQMKQKLEKDDV